MNSRQSYGHKTSRRALWRYKSMSVQDGEDGELDDGHDDNKNFETKGTWGYVIYFNMSEIIFKTTLGKDLTQQQLIDCAKLFSENYGVWSSVAQDYYKFCKQGSSLYSQQLYESTLKVHAFNRFSN